MQKTMGIICILAGIAITIVALPLLALLVFVGCLIYGGMWLIANSD